MPKRMFSIVEANDLIPMLEMAFAQMARWRIVAEEAARSLGGEDVAAAILGGAPVPPGMDEAAQQLETAAKHLRRAIGHVREQGCVVKDLELGLVDFPAALGGRQVNLCWQFGEPEVTHFHGIDEGFLQRRPLHDSPEHEPLRH